MASKKVAEEEKESGEIKAPKAKPAKPNEQTKDLSKPPAGFPGLAGDLA